MTGFLDAASNGPPAAAFPQAKDAAQRRRPAKPHSNAGASLCRSRVRAFSACRFRTSGWLRRSWSCTRTGRKSGTRRTRPASRSRTGSASPASGFSAWESPPSCFVTAYRPAGTGQRPRPASQRAAVSLRGIVAQGGGKVKAAVRRKARNGRKNSEQGLTSAERPDRICKLIVPRRTAFAGVAQWSGHQPSTMGMRVRFSSPAPSAPVAQLDRASAF